MLNIETGELIFPLGPPDLGNPLAATRQDQGGPALKIMKEISESNILLAALLIATAAFLAGATVIGFHKALEMGLTFPNPSGLHL